VPIIFDFDKVPEDFWKRNFENQTDFSPAKKDKNMNTQKQEDSRNHNFRSIICCDCREHLITLDAYEDEPIVSLRWWTLPDYMDTSLIRRIKQAYNILRGRSVEFRDFILNKETLDELVNGCIEAQNFVSQPYNEEEEKEIHEAILEIRKKYNFPQ
jgi:hypothetical protein